MSDSADGDEIVVIEESVDEPRARAGAGLGGSGFELTKLGEGGGAGGGFAGIWGSSEDGLEGGVDEVVIAGGGLEVLEPAGDVCGGVEGLAAVDQGEGLLGDDAFGAAVTFLDEGVVEETEEQILVVAGMFEIEAPPGSWRRLSGVERGASEGEVEVAGKVEQGIAEDLGFHAAGGEFPEQQVVRITCERFGISVAEGAVPAEGFGGDDETVEVFEIPVMVEQFEGEEIEDLVEGRAWTAASEVGGVIDERLAKAAGPNVIGGDAGGERVFWINDPTGESKAPARALARVAGGVGVELVFGGFEGLARTWQGTVGSVHGALEEGLLGGGEVFFSFAQFFAQLLGISGAVRLR